MNKAISAPSSFCVKNQLIMFFVLLDISLVVNITDKKKIDFYSLLYKIPTLLIDILTIELLELF